MSKLVVVTGGLREPSSTRLLADRIDAAVRERGVLGGRRDAVELREPAKRLLGRGPHLRVRLDAVNRVAVLQEEGR